MGDQDALSRCMDELKNKFIVNETIWKRSKREHEENMEKVVRENQQMAQAYAMQERENHKLKDMLAEATKGMAIKKLESDEWKRKYLELKKKYKNEFKRMCDQFSSDDEAQAGPSAAKILRSGRSVNESNS